MSFVTEPGQPLASDDGQSAADANPPLLDATLVRSLLALGTKARAALPAQQLLELVPIAIGVFDAAGAMIFCNRRAADLLGLAAGGKPPRDAVRFLKLDGEPLPSDATPVALALRNGRPVRDLEVQIARRDGTAFVAQVSIDPIPAREDSVGGAIAVLQDISRRKSVEQRLRNRDTELQLIRAHAPVVLSHWDCEHRLVFASRAFAERWSSAPEALVGKTVAAILGEEAFAILRPNIERVLTGEAVEFEMAVPYASMGERYVRVAYAPELDDERRVRGYLAVVTDLTERRRTETALRESEERLRMAMRTGKIGLWDWDVRADRVTWTDSLYEIHGVERSSFAATVEAFTALVHPDDRGPVQRAIQSTLDHGAPYELEFRTVRPGGGIAWLFTSAVVMRDDSGPLRMVGATLDITARKTAELALRESEARFRALASHAPVGIFLTDNNGDCVFTNESWRVMSGLTPDQARGKGWTSAVHPEDRERVAREWYASVRERRPFAAEYRFLRGDGAVFWLEGSAVESRNARGLRTGYIGIIVDITQRRAAEEALRESEKRFRTLASHAPVGIFLTSPAGDTLFVNEAWCRIVGVPADRARGRGWVDAIHPEDRARVVAEWERAVARGASSQAEYRFLHADGSVTWVQGNAVQLLDDAARPAGYIGTIADVTERKAAEEKLRAREAQLRLISTNAPIMLAHCDREERILFANRAYAEQLQLEPADIIGRTIREVIGDETHAAIAPYIARVLQGESLTFEVEIPYTPAFDCRFMHVAYEPDVAFDGSVRGWLAAISDITDQKRTEDALRRLAAIVESSDDAIISKDLSGIITSWNRSAERMFGYTAEEALGRPILLLIPDDRREEEAAILERIRAGERLHHFETLRRRKDGSLVDISLSISPLHDATGGVVGASIIARDIGERKKAEAELRRAQQQLEAHASELENAVQERTASLREAIVQMEEFSYSVSHDLRAPLRAMNAYAQALLEDYADRLDDTAKSYLERIQRSSVRMEKLTHDVLTYSRVARADIHLTPLDPDAILGDLVSQYAELQAPAADVEVVRPLHRVLGHESSLGQCLANLLTNAAKFVAPGVKPRIRVRSERMIGPEPLAGGDASASAPAFVRIWIEDNGIGIAPEHHGSLFRVFERVPTRYAYEGTGIGLAIVRKASEKMGGRCGVESDGASGCRFWVELEAAD